LAIFYYSFVTFVLAFFNLRKLYQPPTAATFPTPIIMKQTIIPWKCLIDDTTAPYSENSNTNPNLNFNQGNTIKTNPSPTIIPWKCLKDVETNPPSIPKPPITQQKQIKTFAQVVSHLYDVPTSQLPQPVLKGDNFSVSILEEEYMLGLETCKFNLHARIIWPKGSNPLTVFNLRSKLYLPYGRISASGEYPS
jgi:hypothetical protein